MKRRLLYLVSVATLLLSAFSVVIPPSQAHADVPNEGEGGGVVITLSGTSTPQKYTVKGTMNSTGYNFSYNSSGKTFEVWEVPSAEDCTNIQAQYTMVINVTLGGKNVGGPDRVSLCNGTEQYSDSIAVSSTPVTPSYFASQPVQYKDDSGNLQHYDDSATGVMTEQGGDGKTINLTFNSNGTISKTQVPPGTYQLDFNYVPPGDANQNYTKTITIAPGQTFTLNGAIAGNPNNPGNGDNPNGGSSASSATSQTPQCETSGFAFSWFFCQIINGLTGAMSDLYNDFIQPFLETQPINLTNTQSDPSQTFNIWKNFRVYGDIFLVIALLVVVFGESIGGGLIDAYTAKKVLPRLLVAAVLINISLYLVAFAIDITNIVGNGIGELIEQPFKHAGTFQLKVGGGTASFGLGAVTATGLWALFAGGALLEFLLCFFLIPAFLALLAVLITIIVRTGLIVFLVLISPIAFALYCLPNTEQYFRKWWDLLFRTLLIYPIIAVIFAIANVLSITIDSAASTSIQKPIAQLIAVIALFVPLFLIPYSFRIAGGMLGRLHDVATSARQRGQEAIKGNANDVNSWRNKVRRNLGARNADMNLSGKGIMNQVRPSDFRSGGLDRRRARLSGVRNAYQSFYGKQGMQAMMYDEYKDDSNVMEDLYRYGSGAQSRAAAKADLDSGKIDKADYQQRLFSSSVADNIGRSTFMRRKALTNPNTIKYGIAAGEEGWNEAMGVAQELSGGDVGTYRSLMNEYQAVAKGPAGRPDQSGAVDGGAYDYKRAWNSVGLYEHGHATASSAQSFGSSYLRDFQSAASAGPVASLDDAQRQNLVDSSRFYLEQETLASSASGAVQQAAIDNIKAFKAAGIDQVLEQPMSQDPVNRGTLRDEAKIGRRGYDREEAARRAQEGGS